MNKTVEPTPPPAMLIKRGRLNPADNMKNHNCKWWHCIIYGCIGACLTLLVYWYIQDYYPHRVVLKLSVGDIICSLPGSYSSRYFIVRFAASFRADHGEYYVVYGQEISLPGRYRSKEDGLILGECREHYISRDSYTVGSLNIERMQL